MTTVLAEPRPGVRGEPAFLDALERVLRAIPGGREFLVSGIDWQTYEDMLAVRDDNRPGLRLTYEAGVLEVMTRSRMHELWKTLLGALVECVALELGMRLAPCGEITIRREDLERGFEPDECYYVQNTHRVMPPRELDFRTDPPPDLAIEIEHSRAVLDRLGIFAAFGIPEVWRYDGKTLAVLLLRPNNNYAPSATSRAFPVLPVEGLAGFLGMAGAHEYLDILRQFRAWVRQTLPPSPPAGPTP
jgi:Uma2 family endonuclease